jgi:hypothetical protein
MSLAQGTTQAMSRSANTSPTMSQPSQTTPTMSQSSQTPQTTTQPLDHETHADSSELPNSPIKHFDTPTGLHLVIDFRWSKFRNIVSEKTGDATTPVYIQHFRPTKPQLRFEYATDSSQLATGTINNFSISAECSLNNNTIALKPLKRLKTQYNYLSNTISASPASPAPVSWIANMSLKTWDFVCLDANQIAVAKLSANLWDLKEVGNFYFEGTKEEVSKEMRDEVVVTGLTLLYVMMVRMNNPLHLLGSVFAKPGRVDDGKDGEGVELENRKDR